MNSIKQALAFLALAMSATAPPTKVGWHNFARRVRRWAGLRIPVFPRFALWVTGLPAMAGGAQVDRGGAEALIPEEVAHEIIQNVPNQSVMMTLGRKLPNMTRAQLRMPILANLVEAFFVDGEPTENDTTKGLKKTTRMQWQNKYINVGEIAAIVPIPEAVIDDVDYDLWGEIRPRIEAAIGKVFDMAVLYGTNAPGNWPDSLTQGATDAGQIVTVGSVGPNNDTYDDIFGEGGVWSLVEEDGFNLTGAIASLKMRARLRAMRTPGPEAIPIFFPVPQEKNRYVLDGIQTEFPRNGAINPTETLLLAGDFDQLVWSIRQDISWKMLDQAVIQDENGEIIYNLAQQDMVAMRAVMRLGWQLPNPINDINQDDDTRYPFAIYTPAGT